MVIRQIAKLDLLLRFGLLTLVALLVSSVGVGVGTASAIPSGETTQLSRDNALAFSDGFVPHQLREHRIPGAAVAMVSREGGTFTRGYGVTDVDTGESVDPKETGFAPASVAKLITATAVLQLVDDGRIDLRRDVNDYLSRFQIDDAYPGHPVTTQHLLTHTAGFAAGDYGTAAASPSEVRPLGDYLADHQPGRVRPPGHISVYSNYGMALAGYLVEIRSGVPFHQYVRDHMLDPLGMTHTTFAQPAPEPISANMATRYQVSDGRLVSTTAASYGHAPPHGAGFRSTAGDMGRFMRAHMADGQGILRPETTHAMHRRQFGNSEGTPGMGYGFHEYTHNGRRWLVHHGDIPGALAIFAIDPANGVGIYASYNGNGQEGADDAAWEIVEAFVDRFADSTAMSARRSAHLPDPSQFAGEYADIQVSDTADLGKLQGLMGGVSVTAEPDGTLTTSGGVTQLGPETQYWTQIEPGLFREKGGDKQISFYGDGLLATEDPAGPMVQLAWYQLPTVQLLVAAVSLVVLLGFAVAWPIGYLARRGDRRTALRFAGLPGWLTAALCVASGGSLVAMFANFAQNQAAFFQGGSALFSAIQVLPIVAAVTTVPVLGVTAIAWRKGWWNTSRRVQHTVVVAAAIAYLAIAATNNVLG